MGRLTRTASRQPALSGALLLFVLLTAIYACSIDIRASRGASITGDEPFYLLTTQSLLDDGDLDLTQQYERHSYREFFDHPDGLWRQSVPNDNGELLSPHNPGLSVLLIPGFAVNGLRGVQVQLVLIAAATFALTYVLVARITRAHLAAWFSTFAVALTATAFIYSSEIYPEIPAAFTIVTALLMVPQEARPGWRPAIVVAALLTMTMWLGIKYAPLAAIVGAWFIWRAGPGGRAAFLAFGSASALAFTWFHLSTFGELTPYSLNTVYAGDSTLTVLDSHVAWSDRVYRLWGLFIDRRFGIARWAPILFVALAGLPHLARHSAITRVALGLIVAQLLIATFVAITMMGWWFPGRTMATILPLFALPLALAVQRSPRWFAAVAAAMSAWTLAITAALAYAGHRGELTIAVDPFTLDAAPFEWPAAAFPQYTSWGAETIALTVLWLSAAGVVSLVGVVLARRGPLRLRRPPSAPSLDESRHPLLRA